MSMKDGLAIAVLQRMKGKGKPTEDEDSNVDSSDEYSVVADEILEAIDKKDQEALVDGLKAFVRLCMDDE